MNGGPSFHSMLMQFADHDCTMSNEDLVRAGLVIIDEVQARGGTLVVRGLYNPADESLLRPCDH